MNHKLFCCVEADEKVRLFRWLCSKIICTCFLNERNTSSGRDCRAERYFIIYKTLLTVLEIKRMDI